MSIFMCERSSDWVNDAFDYQSILGIIDPSLFLDHFPIGAQPCLAQKMSSWARNKKQIG